MINFEKSALDHSVDSLKPQSPGGTQTFLERRFFFVGVMVLVFALAASWYVMFGPPICDQLKTTTFFTLLSLAAGFLAWTFAGNIKIESRKAIPGLAIVAGGGFAMFVLLQYKLDPKDIQLDTRCAGGTDGVAQFYSEVAVHTSNVVTLLTEAKQNSSLNAVLHNDALALLSKIRHFPSEKLSPFQKAILNVYGAQVASALACSLEVKASNANSGRTFSQEAVRYATEAESQIVDLGIC